MFQKINNFRIKGCWHLKKELSFFVVIQDSVLYFFETVCISFLVVNYYVYSNAVKGGISFYNNKKKCSLPVVFVRIYGIALLGNRKTSPFLIFTFQHIIIKTMDFIHLFCIIFPEYFCFEYVIYKFLTKRNVMSFIVSTRLSADMLPQHNTVINKLNLTTSNNIHNYYKLIHKKIGKWIFKYSKKHYF